MKHLKFIAEQTSTGFSAYEENLPIYTTGKDIKTLTDNCKSAAETYFDYVNDAEPFVFTITFP